MMGFALMIFLFGTITYRFQEKTEEKNVFARISHVFVTAARNRRVTSLAISAEQEASGITPHQDSQKIRFLNQALVSPNGSNEGNVCSADEVEEAKAVLR